MAGSKSRRHYLFTGDDDRFENGTTYTIRQISDITKMGAGAVRNRIGFLGSFNNEHLIGVRAWGSRSGRSLSESQKALWYTKKAKIVKACVFSETRFLLADDPVRLQKVNRWLDSVKDETEKFWHGIDYLTLDEIIKIAVKKDVAA
jgi:hypothetical protein